ncbi:MAG: hypothetical protein IPL61_19695 [Myxococcales bacterium]|nr:hypothetical protein [Myxococcales bacterium]
MDGAGAVSRNYWPCGAALLQISVFPNPEAGVSDNDYPSIIDFEPKKRELYEAVTSTNEMLSGSSGNTNTRKGGTTTESLEASISTRVSIPLVGGSDISVTGRYSQEDVDITTTDASTERRETAGRSTQLSQLYQLFNGYHLGTNRAVFISFPRPHNVSSSDQMDNNLVSGERGLEGVQDVFLIVLVPKTVPGFCVRAGLDTSHKTQLASGGVRYVTPRRVVRGCGAFQDDRIVPVAPSVVTPPPRPLIVDDGDVLGWVDSLVPQMKSGRAGRIAAADTLNLGVADLRKSVLGNLAAGKYRARPFASTETFQQIVALEMRASKLSLDKLVTLNYITAAEKAALTNIAIGDVAQLFAELDPAKVSASPPTSVRASSLPSRPRPCRARPETPSSVRAARLTKASASAAAASDAQTCAVVESLEVAVPLSPEELGSKIESAQDVETAQALARQLAAQAVQLAPSLFAVKDDVDAYKAAQTLLELYAPKLSGIGKPQVVTAAAIEIAKLGRQQAHSTSTPAPANVVGDPVEHHRGEFVHEESDLVVSGAGLDFAFHRTYRHQTIARGPLGFRWDHGYNMRLDVHETVAVLSMGGGRNETYRRHSAGPPQTSRTTCRPTASTRPSSRSASPTPRSAGPVGPQTVSGMSSSPSRVDGCVPPRPGRRPLGQLPAVRLHDPAFGPRRARPVSRQPRRSLGPVRL